MSKRKPTPGELEYRRRFPLDTPGRFYDGIASRIRAGEPEESVLHDYGMLTQDECKLLQAGGGDLLIRAISQRMATERENMRLSAIVETARAFAASVPNLQDVTEGAALLAAIAALEADGRKARERVKDEV